MDIEVTFKAVLKDENWNWSEIAPNGIIEGDVVQKIVDRIKTLHLNFKSGEVYIRPVDFRGDRYQHIVIFRRNERINNDKE